MLMKQIIILPIFLLLIGCGIMNNPKDEGNTAKISRIFTADLNNTEINQAFIDSAPLTGFEDVAYSVIDSNASLNLFTQDLNRSATQSAFVKIKATQWITLLTDANVDFAKYNILFYIFKSAVCRYNDTTFVEKKNVEIKITLQSNLCGTAPALFIYAYSVSKEINQIIVKVEGMDDVNITNSSSIP